MFGINKADLVKGLRILRKQNCAYKGPKCDCKYGVAEQSRFGEEQNGCPKISQSLALIGAMTESEFQNLCQRAQITVSSWKRDEK